MEAASPRGLVNRRVDNHNKILIPQTIPVGRTEYPPFFEGLALTDLALQPLSKACGSPSALTSTIFVDGALQSLVKLGEGLHYLHIVVSQRSTNARRSDFIRLEIEF
jgi:hypothetical protein